MLHRSGLFARFAAPGEDLLRPKAIPTGGLGNDCVRLQRLRDDPRLVIHRPVTPTAGTVDHHPLLCSSSMRLIVSEAGVGPNSAQWLR